MTRSIPVHDASPDLPTMKLQQRTDQQAELEVLEEQNHERLRQLRGEEIPDAPAEEEMADQPSPKLSSSACGFLPLGSNALNSAREEREGEDYREYLKLCEEDDRNEGMAPSWGHGLDARAEEGMAARLPPSAYGTSPLVEYERNGLLGELDGRGSEGSVVGRGAAGPSSSSNRRISLLEAYQNELIMLEQANAKRLTKEERERVSEGAAGEEVGAGPMPLTNCTLRLEDYEAHSKMLEETNKDRLRRERGDRTPGKSAAEEMATDSASASNHPSNLGESALARRMATDQKQQRPGDRRRQKAKKPPLPYNRCNSDFRPRDFGKPFCRFLTNNPTVFHAVDRIGTQLSNNDFTKLSARDEWKLKNGGKYYVERNGSSLVAFAVGKEYRPGNGIAMIAGHVDALTVKLKPIPGLESRDGYVQLGVAPYAGGMNDTWWDRDLGIGGKVLVREKSGKIVPKLVNLNQPIARIPTLAPHFGEISQPPFNMETQMAPIIGLERPEDAQAELLKTGDEGTFASTQPPRLVKAISKELGISDYNTIINWELELYDVQPATLAGLDKELIYGGRIDDKLCSWAAIQALLGSCHEPADDDFTRSEPADEPKDESYIKMVALFDNEEIGSLTRQGARSDLLSTTIARTVDSLHATSITTPTAQPTDLLARTLATSFLLSADVTHATNPNFPSAYLPNHSPRLNTGLVISHDSNGHLTTDSTSAGFMQEIARRTGVKLQTFQVRNDTRSGGTIGPMTGAKLGVRGCDVGMPELSMHSIRAATGSEDPGLGVQAFRGFLDWFGVVDGAFV